MVIEGAFLCVLLSTTAVDSLVGAHFLPQLEQK